MQLLNCAPDPFLQLSGLGRKPLFLRLHVLRRFPKTWSVMIGRASQTTGVAVSNFQDLATGIQEFRFNVV